ncbi:MAG: MerR family DNA-binding transcriptional regulator [Betaproteobacteria bacterium]|nr:MerR family DNA-binding transcriptional regulator [Betaproteobacteria bacterium]
MRSSPHQHEATYSIGDLAREFDVTPRAIRFYEDQGLLAPQRSGSRRIYGKRDYVRLKLILRGKRLGLSLSEVGAMFDLYDSAQDEKPQLAKFLASLAERREQLERQRADIDEMLGEVAIFEAQCRRILAGDRKPGGRARKPAV